MRQTTLGTFCSKFREEDTAGQSNQEHEGDERRLPHEKPNHCLLPVIVVFERHDTGHDLRLTGNTEPSEEEGSNPKRSSKHKATREDIDHRGVNGVQFVVQSRQATRTLESDDTQDGRTDNHHT